jgi:CRISPR-associated protein Cas2
MHIRHFCGNRGDILLVLITYDVNTENEAGKSRLRKVAKQCVNYGVRVQNSVFECILTETQYVILKNKLNGIIDTEQDSIRFYMLGKNWKNKVKTIGKDIGIDFTGDLII